MRLAVQIAELADDGESLLAMGEGLVVVVLLGKVPGDVVEGSGLPGPAPRGPGVREALPGMTECFRVAALSSGQPGEAQVSLGLAGVIAEFPEQIQSELGRQSSLARRAPRTPMPNSGCRG